MDQITGLPPTIAIEQRTSQFGRRSTVGTITETYHLLRLLYAKLGRQRCPGCGRDLENLTVDDILARVRQEAGRGSRKTPGPAGPWAKRNIPGPFCPPETHGVRAGKSRRQVCAP